MRLSLDLQDVRLDVFQYESGLVVGVVDQINDVGVSMGTPR